MSADGFNRAHKVAPVRIVGGSRKTDWGEEVDGPREDLPPALFSPGASTQDNLLNQDFDRRGSLRWPHQLVQLEPEDEIEIEGQKWQVRGYPNVWPLGTTVSMERFK
jgi:hypothetical protein